MRYSPDVYTNIFQSIILACCLAICARTLYVTKRKGWFLLGCFFATYLLGDIYWLGYILIRGTTPYIFYVADISWIASYSFLSIVVRSFPESRSKKYQSIFSYIWLVFSIVSTIYFYTFGDIINTTVMDFVVSLAGLYAINGMSNCRNKIKKENGDKTIFGNYYMVYLVVLLITIMEYGLWHMSTFFDTLTFANPYYWFDIGLTITFGLMVLAYYSADEIDKGESLSD